jgi:ribosomal protein S18 acetylase RimI-like enzyme
MDPASAEIHRTPASTLTTAVHVRPAVEGDHQAIANMMYFELHVHRHLDWRAPLDWLGASGFWVIERNQHIEAALACPPDPPGIYWIRLFTHNCQTDSRQAWDTIWPSVKNEISKSGKAQIACIAMQDWLKDILQTSAFVHLQDIVLLEWQDASVTVRSLPPGLHLRAMRPEDIPAVSELDTAAFDLLWQNSLNTLRYAYPQAAFATVVEARSGLVGYQISTQNPFGVHLARLAVHPDVQSQGIGSALIADLLQRTQAQGFTRISVNTQSDNTASLALYEKLGFKQMNQKYPVYGFEVSS